MHEEADTPAWAGVDVGSLSAGPGEEAEDWAGMVINTRVGFNIGLSTQE